MSTENVYVGVQQGAGSKSSKSNDRPRCHQGREGARRHGVGRRLEPRHLLREGILKQAWRSRTIALPAHLPGCRMRTWRCLAWARQASDLPSLCSAWHFPQYPPHRRAQQHRARSGEDCRQAWARCRHHRKHSAGRSSALGRDQRSARDDRAGNRERSSRRLARRTGPNGADGRCRLLAMRSRPRH